jgi:hypothetical protein
LADGWLNDSIAALNGRSALWNCAFGPIEAVVDQICASSNQIVAWLTQLDGLRVGGIE